MTKIQSKSKIKNSQQKYKNNDEKDLDYIEKLKEKSERQLKVILDNLEKETIKIAAEKTRIENKLKEKIKKSHFVKDALMEKWRTPSKELLEAIDGAGEVEVMITLESCYENVYLKDKNLKTESGNGDFKEESDETYIMAKTSSNTQEGVIIKVYEPVVKGVAVVASGGESEKVKMAIIETVSAVFNIDSTNISVEKMKTERKE